MERLYLAVGRGHVPTLAQVRMRFRQLWSDGFDASKVRFARPELDTGFYLRPRATAASRTTTAPTTPSTATRRWASSRRWTSSSGPTRSRCASRGSSTAWCARATARPRSTTSRPARACRRSRSSMPTASSRSTRSGWRARAASTARCAWSGTTCGPASCAPRSESRASWRASSRRRSTLVQRIQSEREFAPVPGRLCAWCEYRDGCSASPLRRADRPSYDAPAPRALARSRRARVAVSSNQLSLPFC